MNDTISRQAAIDAIFGRSHEIIKMRIGNLPSADRTGEWMEDEDGYFRCSHCGKYPLYQRSHSDFCPNCGADMRGEDNETD